MNIIAAAVGVVGLGIGAVGVAGLGGGSCALSSGSCSTGTSATTAAITTVAMHTQAPGCVGCKEANANGTECASCASPAAEEKQAHACPMCEAHAEGESCSMCASDAVEIDADHALMSESEAAQVDPAEYASAAWPKHNKGDSLYAKDLQGQRLITPLGNEKWLTKKISTKGKVVVLDFWATWCPPCRSAMPKLDKLQLKNKDTLAILAIGGQREDEQAVQSFIDDHEYSISDLFDADQSVFAPFESEGIPLVVVLSSDGVIRWIGNPHQPEFEKAVKQTIKVDPMTKSS